MSVCALFEYLHDRSECGSIHRNGHIGPLKSICYCKPQNSNFQIKSDGRRPGGIEMV